MALLNFEKLKPLARLLGRLDAVFMVLRDWQPPSRPGNTGIMRRRYHEEGLPAAGVGETAARRKRHQAAVDALVEARLLVRASRLGLRFTEAGEALARVLAYQPLPSQAWELLAKLDRLCCRPGLKPSRGDWWTPCAGIRLVAWRAIAGVSQSTPGQWWEEADWKHEHQWALDGLLPAMVRGYVIGRSDIERRVYFMTTDRGRAYLAKGQTLADDPDADGHARFADLYDRSYNIACSDLGGLASDPNDIGEPPLPSAIGPDALQWAPEEDSCVVASPA